MADCMVSFHMKDKNTMTLNAMITRYTKGGNLVSTKKLLNQSL